MNSEILRATVKDMLRIGLLAADESKGTPEKPKTIEKRMAQCGIEPTEQNIAAWRHLVRDTPGLGDYVSGVILEESRVLPDASVYAGFGVVPGVKVDKGTHGIVGNRETLSPVEDTNDLAGRLRKYQTSGARFAKWRTTTEIGNGKPTQEAIRKNMPTLARYAAICQGVERQNYGLDIVPVCEPEVLIDGMHGIGASYKFTKDVLRTLFDELGAANIYLPGAVLKTSMVIWGKEYKRRRSHDEMRDVAALTLECLKETVPKSLGGVVFLSGGQKDLEAVFHLNYMHPNGEVLPWPLTFSYSRAIQDVAMNVWKGKPENVERAQAALIERAQAAALARDGKLPEDFRYEILA